MAKSFFRIFPLYTPAPKCNIIRNPCPIPCPSPCPSPCGKAPRAPPPRTC